MTFRMHYLVVPMLSLACSTQLLAQTPPPVSVQAESLAGSIGVNVTPGGAVDITLPNGTSPFTRKSTRTMTFDASSMTRFDTSASGIQLQIDRPLLTPPAASATTVDVQGLLNQFAPQVRMDRGGVELNTPGMRIDTRGGVTVDLNTAQGQIRVSEMALRRFALAREAFAKKEFRMALELIDAALVEMPQEPEMLQFRSMCLFAMAQYDAAADAAYRAMALDDPWSWKELSAHYREPQLYIQQYRALQESAAAAPQSVEQHFLLGYHYMMLGHLQAADRELAAADKLLPGDTVIMKLRKMLETAPAPPTVD